MITEYHRPTTMDEALALLAREEPLTLPLAGGSALNRPSPEEFAVVDLQALGLDRFQQGRNTLALGATLTLGVMLEKVRAMDLELSPALVEAIEHEATHNLRQVATVAGTLVAVGGRSPFTTTLLALDATLNLQPGDEQISLGDLLPVRRERLRKRLITQVTISTRAKLAYEYVARTPADQPIVCAGLALWPSGRVRLALGGFGESPTLAFDGTEPAGIEIAAQSAYKEAGDEWASSEYRGEIAGVLAGRCLRQVQKR